MILTATVLDIARQHIGTKENPGTPNAGPMVNLYLAAVGLSPGYAWCSAFLFYCFRQAAKQIGLANPFPKTASSLRVWDFAEPICRDPNPQPGYVYVLRHSSDAGHVGIVESVVGGVITEISGNTREMHGGREGNCVARHTGQPEVVHGPAELLGYLDFDRAAQAQNVVA